MQKMKVLARHVPIDTSSVAGQRLSGKMKRVLLAGIWLLWGAMLSGADTKQAPITEKVPRAALIEFTANDNSYRSRVAAVHLASVLQAELEKDSQVQWVERADLETAEKEFTVSQFGFKDTSAALHRGKYAKADWLVTGRYVSFPPDSRSLFLEVIDLAHADVLAERKVNLSSVTGQTLESILPKIPVLVEELRETLKVARNWWDTSLGKPTMALLYFLFSEKFEDELARAIEKTQSAATGLRLLRFPKAGQSFTEAEMILLGLVEQDIHAWETLADVYAWGSFSVQENRDYRGAKYTPQVEFSLWDGQREPTLLRVSGQDAQTSEAALQQVPALALRLTQLLPKVQTRTKREATADFRTRISQSIFKQTKIFRESPRRWVELSRIPDVQVRQVFLKSIQMLETACFFDPRNQAARELLLRVRWYAGNSYQGKNRFGYDLNRSIAWGRYVDSFGWQGTNLSVSSWDIDGTSVVDLYLSSAVLLVDTATLGNKEDFGFPRDMSGDIARKWQTQFATEAAKRIIQVQKPGYGRSIIGGLAGGSAPYMTIDPKLRAQCIETIWPEFISTVPPGQDEKTFAKLCQAITETYLSLGLAGREKPLLAQLVKPYPKEDPKVQLPRAADFQTGAPAQDKVPSGSR